jgi:flagellar basal-body rod protein FlgC
MSLITAIDISSTGLSAQRARAENNATNIANAQVTRTPEGGPFRRKDVVFESFSFDQTLASTLQEAPQGVKVSEMVADESPFVRRWEPWHPDADDEGYVHYPNVNVMGEMVDLAAAARSYEANLSAMNVAKALISKTLEIGR